MKLALNYTSTEYLDDISAFKSYGGWLLTVEVHMMQLTQPRLEISIVSSNLKLEIPFSISLKTAVSSCSPTLLHFIALLGCNQGKTLVRRLGMSLAGNVKNMFSGACVSYILQVQGTLSTLT